MVKDNLNKNSVTLGQFKQFQHDVNNNFDKVHEEITGTKTILNQHSNTFSSLGVAVTEHSKKLMSIESTLADHSRTLSSIESILTEHTEALLSIESTMKFYGDMYKINKDEIQAIDKRITVLESL